MSKRGSVGDEDLVERGQEAIAGEMLAEAIVRRLLVCEPS